MHRLAPLIAAGALATGAAVAVQAAETEADAAGDTISLQTLFERLDSDNDGTLTRAEAEANPRVAEIYDSLDTRENIENPSTNAPAEGINFNQFEAGMTADREGKGTVGPAASGGETYLVYPDGSRERIDDSGIDSSD